MKRLLKPIGKRVLRAFSRLTSPVVALVGRTGFGSEHYLRRGVLPVAVHYYQPVFDPDSLPASVWARRHDLPGIDFRTQEQLEFLRDLGRFGDECRWPEAPDPADPTRYHWDNGSFSYSSGCLLHSVVRHFDPKRVVEIGAGLSTLLLAETLATNEREHGGKRELVTVDPYPTDAVKALPDARRRLIPTDVQGVAIEELTALGEGDLLFIDSSHVVRTGGDVNYLYLDVLPRIRPGVVVHVHDIQLPYEYARSYSSQTEAPRLFWTEQYLLQAFLALNPHYRVLLAGHWCQRDHADAFATAFPHFDPERHRPTTSFYMQRQ
jgi:predicted O-methyltransferase YrrM